MTTRPDLDLSDLVSLYDEVWSDQVHQHPTPVEIDPIVLPHAPLHCTTSAALVPADPPFAWDTNGWYQHLGIKFPYRVRRTRLAQHYLAVGGQCDARATWIFKQLLNPDVRRAYDLTPLGSVYENDPVVQRMLKDQAAQVKARAAAEGRQITDEEAAAELGLDLKENSCNTLDESHGTDHTGFHHYSYWVQEMLDLPLYDDLYLEHLEAWRTLIHRICRRAGLNLRFSLGLTVGSEYHIQQATATQRLKVLDSAITETQPAFTIILGMQIPPTDDNAKDLLITLLNEFPSHI